MPLYEYQCVGCGGRLERRQRFDEAPLTDCPECGQRLRRLLHPAGIIFKGSGWYVTDSRPRPAESAAAADGKGTSGSAASESGSGSRSSDGADGKSGKAADKPAAPA